MTKKTIKKLIIEALVKEFPLSAKELFNKIKKENDVTYQGVHKTLFQLETEGQVLKNKNKYEINADWIEKQKNFFEKASLKYAGKITLELTTLNEGESRIVLFSCPVDMAYWMISEYNKILKKRSKKQNYMLWNWFWPGIMVSDKEYPNLKRMFELGNFILTSEKQTKLDELIANYYKEMNAKTLFNVKLPEGTEELIVEDFIVKVIWTKESKEKRRKIYEQTKNMDSAITKLYEHGFRKDDKLQVIVIRNKQMAENLRETLKDLK